MTSEKLSRLSFLRFTINDGPLRRYISFPPQKIVPQFALVIGQINYGDIFKGQWSSKLGTSSHHSLLGC